MRVCRKPCWWWGAHEYTPNQIKQNQTVGSPYGPCSDEILKPSLLHMKGVCKKLFDKATNCDFCAVVKFTRFLRKSLTSEEHATYINKRPKRIYTYVAGPMKYNSAGKLRFFVALLNSKYWFSMGLFVCRSNETASAAIKMILEVNVSFKDKVKEQTPINWNIVKWGRSEGGGKYVGSDFKDLVRQQGIMYKDTAQYFSESNRWAKRLKWSLLNITRTMSLNIEIRRQCLWVEAVNSAWFLCKWLATKSWKNRCTPNDLIYRTRPRFEISCVFGSRAFVSRSGESGMESLMYGRQRSSWLILLKETRTEW